MKYPVRTGDVLRPLAREYFDQARMYARELLMIRSAITVNDVYEKYPRPDYVKPNAMGRLFQHPDFKALSTYAPARHSKAHGHLLKQWTLNEDAMPSVTKQLTRIRELSKAQD